MAIWTTILTALRFRAGTPQPVTRPAYRNYLNAVDVFRLSQTTDVSPRLKTNTSVTHRVRLEAK